MELRIEDVGTTKVFLVDGPLDEKAALDLQQTILEVVEEGHHHVIIDLRRVPRVSSHALRTFLMLTRRLDSMSGRLALCAPSPDVTSALAMSGLNRLCFVTPTRDEALRRLALDERIDRLAVLVSELLARAETRRQAATPA